MNKQVNFVDNIFLLMMRLRMIRDTLTLDADPELFLEKTLDDIGFIDNALNLLLRYLQENYRLIERDELMDHIAELEKQFSQVLSDLLGHNGNFIVQQIPSVKEKINGFIINSQERRRAAGSPTPAGKSQNGEPMVSSDELAELLKAL